MRVFAILAVTAAACLPACGADALPHDEAKARQLREDAIANHMAKTYEVYKSSGNRSPKWDLLVQAAHKHNSERMFGPELLQIENTALFLESVTEAIKAGCDDPLIIYYRVKFSNEEFTPEVRKALEQNARDLEKSQYSDLDKARAWHSAAVARLTPGPDETKREEADWRRGLECHKAVVTKLTALARSKDRHDREGAREIACQQLSLGATFGYRQQFYNNIRNVLSTFSSADILRNLIEGSFYIDYAWEARGNGFADEVTEEGAKLYKERLVKAREHFAAAWRADDQCAEAAVGMIRVCVGLGLPAEEMETWFARARKANPTLYEAFEAKFNYLKPQWHGSNEELLAYARQLAKHPDWGRQVPILMMAAHELIARQSGDSVAYFTRNPQVWKDIQPVLEEMRKRFPKSIMGATLYLHYARLCNKNRVQAAEYATPVKDKLKMNGFMDQQEIDAALQWAGIKN
ncbi:hypothetical protein [Zavarzinella formosa]|uniref:hypothetical protein n=1 Tax=Zavarzinella formosa TaxID=360055 RepID=UPI00031D00A9|nr:hypothetical protein [Zavarzinella formosa]